MEQSTHNNRQPTANDASDASGDRTQTQTYTYRGKTYTRTVASQPQVAPKNATVMYRGAAYTQAQPANPQEKPPSLVKEASKEPTSPAVPTPVTAPQNQRDQEIEVSLAELDHLEVVKLIPLLQDENSKIRARAATSLSRWGNEAKAAIPFLLPLLKDSAIEVKFCAAKTLILLDKEQYAFTYKYIEALYLAQRN